MDLHIGVTTSTRVVVEYDKDGIRRTYDKVKNSPWAQSLLVDSICDGWMEHWDAVLDEVFCFRHFSYCFNNTTCNLYYRLAYKRDGCLMNTKRLHIIVTHLY